MSEDRRPVEEPEGAEPLEEVGPGESEVPATSVELRTEQMTEEGVAESEFQMRDEVAEAFPIEPIPMVAHPVDGLPVPANERHGLATAPPFTHEHMTCVEDDRQFVEIFEEEQFRRPELDRRLMALLTFRSQYDDAGTLRERTVFEPNEVEQKFGHRVARGGQGWQLVRPIREACTYYKRQVFPNEEIPDPDAFGHRIVFRNCTMRRSVGGAFMSLRDEAVYACDYRNPAEPKSVDQYLDKPDRAKLRSNAHLKLIGLFGVTAEPDTYRREEPEREVGANVEKKGEAP
jgi:hypothetical protein